MAHTDMKRNANNTFNRLQEARQEFRGESNSGINSLSDRLIVSEYMIQALWNMLVKRGATKDELFSEVEKIMEKQKNAYTKVPKYTCPKCGKIMQVGNKNPFTCNCMYCGALRTIYPFDNIDDLEAAGEEGYVKPVVEEKDPLDDLGF